MNRDRYADTILIGGRVFTLDAGDTQLSIARRSASGRQSKRFVVCT